MANNAYELTGQNGWELIDDTSAHTNGSDGYSGVVAVNNANAVINNSGSTVANATDFDANITLIPGQELGGHWTSITLVSGAVVAYKR